MYADPAPARRRGGRGLLRAPRGGDQRSAGPHRLPGVPGTDHGLQPRSGASRSASWTSRFRDWMQESGPAEVLAACIFFDLRPAGGTAELASRLRAVIRTEAPGRASPARPPGARRGGTAGRRSQSSGTSGWRGASRIAARSTSRAAAASSSSAPPGSKPSRSASRRRTPSTGSGRRPRAESTARPSAARSRTPISSSSGSGSSTSSVAWSAASPPTTGSARRGCRTRRRCSSAGRAPHRRPGAGGTPRAVRDGPAPVRGPARWLVPRAARPCPGSPAARRCWLDDFVSIDLETTGLDATRDAAVAMAVVPFRGGEPTGGYETLVNPGRPIPAVSTRIHGITDEMVKAAPRLGDVLDEIEALFGVHAVVGHGVAFDLAILEQGPPGSPPLPAREHRPLHDAPGRRPSSRLGGRDPRGRRGEAPGAGGGPPHGPGRRRWWPAP